MSHGHKFSIERAKILDDPKRLSFLNPFDIIRQAGVKEGMYVADIGSGTGFLSIPLSKAVGESGRIFAVDINEGMHDILKGKMEDQGIKNIETTLSQEDRIPLGDASLDMAFTINTFHEFDGDSTLEEVKRILKPHGKFFLIDWKKEEMPMGPPVQERKSLEESKNILAGLGFQVESHGEIGPYNYLIKSLKI